MHSMNESARSNTRRLFAKSNRQQCKRWEVALWLSHNCRWIILRGSAKKYLFWSDVMCDLIPSKKLWSSPYLLLSMLGSERNRNLRRNQNQAQSQNERPSSTSHWNFWLWRLEPSRAILVEPDLTQLFYLWRLDSTHALSWSYFNNITVEDILMIRRL